MLRRTLTATVDLALPPRCMACGQRVGPAGHVCAACWSQLTFIGDPQCQRCGLPFDFAVEGETVCAGCLANPPTFDRARAAMVYDDASRGLILSFKHGDRLQMAAAFSLWAARAGGILMADADLIVPVPLHRWRLLRRRYNQAALIGHGVAQIVRVPHIPDILLRHRATPSQGTLGAHARARNVAGAFRLNPRHEGRIKDARIVLIDDVLTTGATVGACAKILRRGGAARVDVLTVARVVLAD